MLQDIQHQSLDRYIAKVLRGEVRSSHNATSTDIQPQEVITVITFFSEELYQIFFRHKPQEEDIVTLINIYLEATKMFWVHDVVSTSSVHQFTVSDPINTDYVYYIRFCMCPCCEGWTLRLAIVPKT